MAKAKSFLGNRATQPSSASDEDFALVVGSISPTAVARPVYSQHIPLERIEPNPFQARKTFTDLEELADAIRTQGFISRLRVRPIRGREGFFQLVYGERRLRAAKLAGLKEIPCDVSDYTDAELIEIGLAENIQRKDLNPFEEAQAFAQFIESGKYTIRDLAGRIGKNKDYVDGRLSLLRAPEDVQQLVIQMPEALTAARRIATLPDPAERKSLINGILHGELNKEDVREIVRESRSSVAVRLDGQNTAIAKASPGAGAMTTPVRSAVQTSLTLRKLERDRALLLSTLTRWQEAAPSLTAANRGILRDSLRAIRESLDTLEREIGS